MTTIRRVLVLPPLNADGLAEARQEASVRAHHAVMAHGPGAPAGAEGARLHHALTLARRQEARLEVMDARQFLHVRGLAGPKGLEPLTGFVDETGKTLADGRLAEAAARAGEDGLLRDLLTHPKPGVRLTAAVALGHVPTLREVAGGQWVQGGRKARAALRALGVEAPAPEARGGGRESVEEHILTALQDAGRRLTRDELAMAVGGNAAAFARTLRALFGAGRVTRTGAGKHGDPFLYELPPAPAEGEAR